MEYFYLVLTQQDMLQKQVIEEIIRERTNYYISRNDSFNFWILISPLFLLESTRLEKIKQSNFYSQNVNNIYSNDKHYFSAIVSTNSQYINWIKLRLGYFENIDELNFNNYDNTFRSDGICGKLTKEDLKISSPFSFMKNNFHPDIILTNFKVFLNQYESMTVK